MNNINKDINDKQFLKDMIDLALSTNDKEWFTQLTNDLKKLGNKDIDKNLKNKEYISEETEVDLFNPKSFKEGYDDFLEYEYYTCETNCSRGQTLIVIDNKLYQFVNTQAELHKSSCFVRLVNNTGCKKGDMVSKSNLLVYDDEYNDTYIYGYFMGQIDHNQKISNLIKENDLLKSELKTIHNIFFDNKNKKKKFNWKFWKTN